MRPPNPTNSDLNWSTCHVNDSNKNVRMLHQVNSDHAKRPISYVVNECRKNSEFSHTYNIPNYEGIRAYEIEISLNCTTVKAIEAADRYAGVQRSRTFFFAFSPLTGVGRRASSLLYNVHDATYAVSHAYQLVAPPNVNTQ